VHLSCKTLTSCVNDCNDFPENQLIKNTVWTIKTKWHRQVVVRQLVGGTVISRGGTPDTGSGDSTGKEFNFRTVLKVPPS